MTSNERCITRLSVFGCARLSQRNLGLMSSFSAKEEGTSLGELDELVCSKKVNVALSVFLSPGSKARSPKQWQFIHSRHDCSQFCC